MEWIRYVYLDSNGKLTSTQTNIDQKVLEGFLTKFELEKSQITSLITSEYDISIDVNNMNIASRTKKNFNNLK